MNRRSFLAFIGAAPLAAILPVKVQAASPKLIVTGAFDADGMISTGRIVSANGKMRIDLDNGTIEICNCDGRANV